MSIINFQKKITYYKDKINRQSEYIFWMKHNTAGSRDTSLNTIAWGASANSAVAPQFQANAVIATTSLTGGADGNDVSDGDLMGGWNNFNNQEFMVDISVLPTANASATVIKHVIGDIAEKRKDCMVFCSPSMADVTAAYSLVTDNVITFRNSLPSTSYASVDSGYKYQYDRYNDNYRYVPLNGDVAGCVVRTTEERDFFFSPAGFTRGQIKNVVKLPYNPDKSHRDLLYKSGINPVVSFTGQGTILFGDKTLLAKPSAFDRINVRRLFLNLEKATRQTVKFFIFEPNTLLTRTRVINTLSPIFDNAKNTEGLYDFLLVCDERNNTPTVIDQNELIIDIYLKPVRAAEFILVNFYATRTGADFNELVG